MLYAFATLSPDSDATLASPSFSTSNRRVRPSSIDIATNGGASGKVAFINALGIAYEYFADRVSTAVCVRTQYCDKR